ncbi:uncharacterized protein SCHCODRAFT_01261243 [Schizophyllum commune H4-8]|uniref:uncharacterized protein n=1 Tax=Schizophyllum commune (strain H4-8 / FGSC 9210) TaxID=578458 RepID=UPI002160375E|nr:uncharacterized protein SCHCODRAFT_01261243 [Schizophyllum commune H4-8]KAI5884875.1 hypothetical protein SCHCODRAFT_01261243 [Schizophyllum commune H4-8]
MMCMGARGAKCLVGGSPLRSLLRLSLRLSDRPRETRHVQALRRLQSGLAELRTLIVRGGLAWPGCGRGGWVRCPLRAKCHASDALGSPLLEEGRSWRCLMLPLAAGERDFQDRRFRSWRWRSVALWLSAKTPLIAGCLGWRAVYGLHSTLQTNFLEPCRESMRACDILSDAAKRFNPYTWCVVRYIPSC